VPPHTSPTPPPTARTKALVSYLYTDALPPATEPPALADLLHVGCFYGCARLTELCEAGLVAALLEVGARGVVVCVGVGVGGEGQR